MSASSRLPDLNGGLPDDADLAILEGRADDPFYGENHAVWLWDDVNRVGLHTYLKTLGHVSSFAQRRETIYVFLPDGRVLQVDQDGPGPTDPRSPRGPNLEMECLEPFRRWRMAFASTARATSSAELAVDLLRERPPVATAFELELTTAAPPWMLGTFTTGEEVERAKPFFGGVRYEQLIRGTGRVVVEGETFDLSGAGMRTHRIGTRNTGAFPGHTWATALWPDGRSFGYQKHTSLTGEAIFTEGWVCLHGVERLPTKVRTVPMFSAALPDETLVIELESASGVHRIEGALRATNFITNRQPDPQKFLPGFDHTLSEGRIMTQGLAVYRWDGVDGEGMIERSALVADIRARPDLVESAP